MDEQGPIGLRNRGCLRSLLSDLQISSPTEPSETRARPSTSWSRLRSLARGLRRPGTSCATSCTTKTSPTTTRSRLEGSGSGRSFRSQRHGASWSPLTTSSLVRREGTGRTPSSSSLIFSPRPLASWGCRRTSGTSLNNFTRTGAAFHRKKTPKEDAKKITRGVNQGLRK